MKKLFIFILGTFVILSLYLTFNNIYLTEIKNNTTEEYIYKAFKNIKEDTAAKTKIFSTIENIDWKKYDSIEEDAAIKLLDWLSITQISTEDEIVSILKATQHLDGAYAEAYSSIVAKLYLDDKYKFIKCLTTLPEEKIKKISSYVAYGASYYDLSQIENETRDLLNLKGLTADEKETILELVRCMEKVYKE